MEPSVDVGKYPDRAAGENQSQNETSFRSLHHELTSMVLLRSSYFSLTSISSISRCSDQSCSDQSCFDQSCFDKSWTVSSAAMSWLAPGVLTCPPRTRCDHCRDYG